MAAACESQLTSAKHDQLTGWPLLSQLLCNVSHLRYSTTTQVKVWPGVLAAAAPFDLHINIKHD
jgi:hypothetical protein